MSDTWKDGLSLKIVNIVVYFAFLGSNIYAAVIPSSIYYHGRETYITPAPWVFLIWPVIHVLLLGTVIRQFFPSGKKIIIDHMKWNFPLFCILNAIYINLCSRHHYIPAFFLSLFIQLSVSYIFYIIKKLDTGNSFSDMLFIHLPFTIFLGWASVLTIVTAFDAFGVSSLEHQAGPWTKVFVFLALFTVHGTVTAYTFFGDLAACLTDVWCFWAIFTHQTSSGFVHISSLVFFVLALIKVVVVLGICAIIAFGVYAISWYGHGRIVLEDEDRSPLTV